MAPSEDGNGSRSPAYEIWNKATQELGDALAHVARLQQLMSYTDAANAVRCASIEPNSIELVRLLCERMTADLEADRPMLPSIVIGKRTNRPGKGFFQFARQYFRIDDEDLFWFAEVEAVHLHYALRSRRTKTEAMTDRRARIGRPQTTVDLGSEEFIMSFFD